ncbi:MAG: histidine kinase [Acidobacteria bacterium]|nr:MAG: histidine kinase [Acidobacteriota bacterium]
MENDEKIKVLLVDDRPENLLTLEAVLDAPTLELVKVHSGAEALKHILTDEFAVILMDVRMPEMDGFETAELLRKRDKTKHTPIIFLTGFRNEEDLYRGYYAGAVDYLFRPVVPEVLRSKVSIFVELYRKNQLLKRNAEALQRKSRELGTLYEKVKQLDEMRTRFVANLSHELRTPLALVLGPLEKLLGENGLNEKQKREIEVVARNSRILLKHVDDLLTISKLEAAKVELDYQECDLTQLVRSAAAEFEIVAEERRIHISAECPPSVPAQVDVEKIEAVLRNLISNAFKFTPDGGVVHCEVKAAEERASISVQDSGPGVPLSMRRTIFDRFWRGTSSGSGRFGGTGLGLAIAKEFIELHGGAIKVEDAREGGALFTVELPIMAPAGAVVGSAHSRSEVASAAAPLAVEELRPSPSVKVDRGPDRPEMKDAPLVLVTEDNPEMLRFITESLAAEYRTEAALDGEEGLQKALALRPDLILSDILMAPKSGEEMVRELRARPELDGVPVMLLTAVADGSLRTKLLKEGAQDYLLKPFSIEELLARVSNLVTVKRAREALQRELETTGHNLEGLIQELAQRTRSEQAARTEAEEANRAKDRFLAAVSHELRTPLTGILGWCRLLRGGNLDEDTALRALDTIERNTKLQSQLVEELLDISRIISGKLRLDLHPVGLTAVIEAALDAVRPTAESSGIRLNSTLDPAAGLVRGDPDRLQQVVWNLVSNALKFTPAGGDVSVRLARLNSHLEISVSDTGRGISGEFLPHVFERFRQADTSNTQTNGGLGLGLAIARHIVELHGGSVRAESPGEGKGATFTVTLPLMEAESLKRLRGGNTDSRHSRGVEDRLAHAPDLKALRVLVVDDEADTRDMLTVALGNCGADVSAVASTSEALEAIERFQPDVMLSDIKMPGEDGYILMRKLRDLETEKGAHIPAIALTAYAGVEDRLRALSAGFQRHVSKPVEPAELVQVVANLAGRIQ